MKIAYYIPSRGRAGNLPTLSAFSRSMAKDVHIVIPRVESAAYQQYLEQVTTTAALSRLEVIYEPSTVKNIGQCRQFMIERARRDNYTHIIMLDDDLTFAERRTDDNTRFKELPPLGTAFMWERLLQMFKDGYAHVGMLTREGGNRITEKTVICTRMLRILGYDLRVLRDEKIMYDRMELMEDFDVTLQLLRRGYPNALVCDYVHNQKSSNAPGGCSTYRTLEKQKAAALKLAKLHPGFVKVVEKTTKTAWNGQTRTDVQIAWKKAFNSSGATL